jgi:hypothetical protein
MLTLESIQNIDNQLFKLIGKYNIIKVFQSDFYRGGEFLMGES